MAFQIGDPVVVRRIGKGVVREVRRQGRYLVVVGAAALVCDEQDLTPPVPAGRKGRSHAGAAPVGAIEESRPSAAARRLAVLDLHGLTVEEALQVVDERLNAAMLAGLSAMEIIHGKGGGRIRSALHRHLRAIPSVRRFELDARNTGVTHLYF